MRPIFTYPICIFARGFHSYSKWDFMLNIFCYTKNVFLIYFAKKNFVSGKSYIKIIFFIWFYLIFASLLSLDKSIGISHSILFLRFFLFAIALQYWVLSKPKYLKILLYFLTIGFTFVLFDTLIQFLNFDSIKSPIVPKTETIDASSTQSSKLMFDSV